MKKYIIGLVLMSAVGTAFATNFNNFKLNSIVTGYTAASGNGVAFTQSQVYSGINKCNSCGGFNTYNMGDSSSLSLGNSIGESAFKSVIKVRTR